jgi:hypothetical protein
MGNLARAGFPASSSGVWPYTYARLICVLCWPVLIARTATATTHATVRLPTTGSAYGASWASASTSASPTRARGSTLTRHTARSLPASDELRHCVATQGRGSSEIDIVETMTLKQADGKVVNILSQVRALARAAVSLLAPRVLQHALVARSVVQLCALPSVRADCDARRELPTSHAARSTKRGDLPNNYEIFNSSRTYPNAWTGGILA